MIVSVAFSAWGDWGDDDRGDMGGVRVLGDRWEFRCGRSR